MNADELSQSKPDSERDESTLLLGDQSPTREEGEAMSPLDLFIRDLDEKRGKIPCCQEVTDIQTGVENVFKDFLLEVEKENPFLKTTLINSGSFYEGTKVCQPDEFDYFVQLDNFSEPTDIQFDELPGSTVIVIPNKSSFDKLRELSTYAKVPYHISVFDWKTHVNIRHLLLKY